jgi:hypothetical protein
VVRGYRRIINDYLVRSSTANRNNVASQLTHYETDSFAIQNQASHLAFNLMLSERRGGKVAYPPLIVQGKIKKRLGIFMECAPESDLIDESTQSGCRMIG